MGNESTNYLKVFNPLQFQNPTTDALLELLLQLIYL